MGDEQGALSVSAVSLLLGVPVPTIRSWERRYGFPQPNRTLGSHRRYSFQEIDQLRALRDEIASGVPASKAVAAVRAGSEAGGGADRVRMIVDAGLAYDTGTIRSHLEQSALELGLEASIEKVVLPVLRKIGTMWQAGKCEVSQEHVSSQEIRTWLSQRVTGFAPPSNPQSVLLTCGPQDVHTIGLEAFFVMLTRRGLVCRLLGAQTPVTSLVAAVDSIQPGAVVVTSHLGINRRAAMQSLRAVAKMQTRVFYAGNAFTSVKARRGVPGRYLGRNLAAAADKIDQALDGSSH
jgi:MerR family transcriptional regulator, light-induced transcriptional regulator